MHLFCRISLILVLSPLLLLLLLSPDKAVAVEPIGEGKSIQDSFPFVMTLMCSVTSIYTPKDHPDPPRGNWGEERGNTTARTARS